MHYTLFHVAFTDDEQVEEKNYLDFMTAETESWPN